MIYLSDSFDLNMFYDDRGFISNQDFLNWNPVTIEEVKETLKNGFISNIIDKDVVKIVSDILNIPLNISYSYIKLNPEDTFILCGVEESFDIQSLNNPKIKFFKINNKPLDFPK